MISLPVNVGWALYAECEVVYNGRASSRLQHGNYLVLFKPDKSLSIHGATLIQPRNYLAGGTTYTYTDTSITFTCKREEIIISVFNIISITILEEWSDHKITICKTERELALRIFNNWHEIFGDNSDVELIYNEYPTHLGPIDVLGRSLTTDYIIEVKRKTVSLKDVTQLRRYVEAMDGDRITRGYIAAPKISKNAKAYLEKHHLEFLKIEFSD